MEATEISTVRRETGDLLTAEETYRWREELGRQFADEDVRESDMLAQSARRFARLYDGSNRFMREMQVLELQRPTWMSAARLRAILNIVARSAAPAPDPQPDPNGAAVAPKAVAEIPDGIFQIGELALRVEVPQWGTFTDGRRTISFAGGKDGRKWTGFAFLTKDGTLQPWKSKLWATKSIAAATELLASEDPLAYGFAYALLSGRCFVCGFELSDPISVQAGIGPECAKRLGIKRAGLSKEDRAKAAIKKQIEQAAVAA